jgi:hypothetical protein
MIKRGKPAEYPASLLLQPPRISHKVTWDLSAASGTISQCLWLLLHLRLWLVLMNHVAMCKQLHLNQWFPKTSHMK